MAVFAHAVCRVPLVVRDADHRLEQVPLDYVPRELGLAYALVVGGADRGVVWRLEVVRD
jgi:hypothetical protein